MLSIYIRHLYGHLKLQISVNIYYSLATRLDHFLNTNLMFTYLNEIHYIFFPECRNKNCSDVARPLKSKRWSQSLL